ncbi:MAG: biotin-dependent carboxyltransferase [Candidatus Dormibacteraeota bacterium]|uniref:Biotin-dependent carboxyltransferase n=1 Tax=Candidatus Dormiibacter inghamiae TaxID=3127013 RepID=A0A934K8Q8_9BACT|nr:biotin-dependent carboxyltransferase [Candidatus Dormibacteraeota bacterium]MBJ7606322.1 biotin-dependent carboxyltransferase [Candidatus Dormibacteraeota bacterium]
MNETGDQAPQFKVQEPGVFTAIQDLGRPGRRIAGVPPGGAMDRFALAAANLLVGNPAGAAGLECALTGPTLEILDRCVLAVTGADFEPTLNGRTVPGWTGLFCAPGDRLSFGGRRWGARAYVAAAGGLAADRWLGSAATYLLIGRGGLQGRPLKRDDVLHRAGAAPRPLVAGRELPQPFRPPYSSEPELMTVAGPQLGRIKAAGKRLLFGQPWTVSSDADRMGYRLEGPELPTTGADVVSFGLTSGCIQLPPSGQPILLMADGQTAGGYPVVGGVARCDLSLAAQLLPGESLRFRETHVETAQAEYRSRWAALARIR